MSDEEPIIKSTEYVRAGALPQKMENVYAVLADTSGGGEGVAGTLSGMLVGTEREPLIMAARVLSALGKKPLKLVRFVRAEVVEVFEP